MLPAKDGPIAQRLEQATHNRLVTGSNPVGPTHKKDPENKGELVFATHELSIRGHALRRIETAIPPMELSLLTTGLSNHRFGSARAMLFRKSAVSMRIIMPGKN